MRSVYFILALFVLCGTVGCRKKALPTPAEPYVSPVVKEVSGKMKVSVKNMLGSELVSLSPSVSYTLPTGDEISITVYRYYLSNFVLTDKNGNRYTEANSYHLIMADSPQSQTFTFENVPPAQYVSMEFLIGVDSLHNVSGAMEGHLSPSYEMFWTWSSGYIMAKLEGKLKSPKIASVFYHISGFKGQYNVVQNVKLDFPEEAAVTLDKTPVLTLKADLQQWFYFPNFKGFTKLAVISSEGEAAYNISKNYKDMMSVESIKNL